MVQALLLMMCDLGLIQISRVGVGVAEVMALRMGVVEKGQVPLTVTAAVGEVLADQRV